MLYVTWQASFNYSCSASAVYCRLKAQSVRVAQDGGVCISTRVYVVLCTCTYVYVRVCIVCVYMYYVRIRTVYVYVHMCVNDFVHTWLSPSMRPGITMATICHLVVMVMHTYARNNSTLLCSHIFLTCRQWSSLLLSKCRDMQPCLLQPSSTLMQYSRTPSRPPFFPPY